MWIYGSGFPKSHNNFGLNGYGTALKPAYEPIILAMKSLDGTFAQNAEKWGVGGINIDECRIEGPEWKRPSRPNIRGGNYCNSDEEPIARSNDKGRWPSNLILDEESAEMLDQMTGISKSPSGIVKGQSRSSGIMGKPSGHHYQQGYGDSGGASRFFYCAKSSTRERNEGLDKPSSHPTVKPLSLMRYIIKLLAPPGDPVLLDPFAGSGSSCIAALQLGIRSIGIEKNEEYVEIARKRLEHHGQVYKQDLERKQRCQQETFDFEKDG